jgi:hypothetical protein
VTEDVTRIATTADRRVRFIAEILTPVSAVRVGKRMAVESG